MPCQTWHGNHGSGQQHFNLQGSWLRSLHNNRGHPGRMTGRKIMARLAGRVALIVGAGTGIGKATAKLFTSEGAKVVITMRTEANGKTAVDEIKADGGEASYIVGDAGKREDCARMVAETVARHGRLDILILNAAALSPGMVDELTDEAL